MKAPWRRGPSRLAEAGRATAPDRPQEAMAAAEEPGVEAAADLTAGYERVCTRQGRRAHLRASPMFPVLCGWPGRMIPADPSMEECLMCKAALRAMTEAAS